MLVGTFTSQLAAADLVLVGRPGDLELDSTGGSADNPVERRSSLTDTFHFFETNPTATFTVLLPELYDNGDTTFTAWRPRNPAGDSPTGFYREEVAFATETVTGVNPDNPEVPQDYQVVKLTPTEFTVELLPDNAPQQVANFISYAVEGDYDNTVVHRNPGMGVYSAQYTFDFNIAQAGSYTLTPTEPAEDDPYQVENYSSFDWAAITSRGTIAAEEGDLEAEPGTLATALNSSGYATSGWFFNISDNSDAFANAYPIFGKVTGDAYQNGTSIGSAQDTVLGVLGQIPALDLQVLLPSAFADVPLMVNGAPEGTPDYDDPAAGESDPPIDSIIATHENYIWADAYVRFPSVTLDDLGEEPTANSINYTIETYYDEEDEVSSGNDRDSFDIDSLAVDPATNEIVVGVVKPGTLLVTVTATNASDSTDEESILLRLTAVNPEMANFFKTYSAVYGPDDEDDWNGYYVTALAGVYDYDFPLVYFNYYGWMWLDAGADEDGFWTYYYDMGHWIYTTADAPSLLYVETGTDADDKAWIYYNTYDKDSDSSTPNERWVYLYPRDDADPDDVWIKPEELATRTISDILDEAKAAAAEEEATTTE